VAVTPASLVNQALLKIGQTKLITSLTESSTAAKAAATVFDTARDATLAARWWPFAKKTAALAQLNTTRKGWCYVYAPPADMLVERELFRHSQEPPHLMEMQANDAGSGLVICTDCPGAVLVYTQAITLLDAFPADVREAFVWKLAAELVLSLPVKPELRRVAMAEYEGAVSAAFARALNSTTEREPEKISSFERARLSGRSRFRGPFGDDEETF